MAEFDPDAYLNESSGFDPDAYLGEQPQEQPSDFASQYHSGQLDDRKKSIIEELAKRGEVELDLDPGKGFIERVQGDITKRTESVRGMIERNAPSGEKGTVGAIGEIALELPSTTALAVGQGAGLGIDIAGEALVSGFGMLPESVKGVISEKAKALMETEIGKYGLKAIEKGGEIWNHFKESYPDSAMALEGIVNLTALSGGRAAAETAKGVGKEVAYTADDIAKTLSKPFSTPAESKISKAVKEGYEKGIRPTVSGKGTFSRASKSSEKAKEAVKEIVNMKDELVFTAETGEKITGALPKNLNQFSEAVGQAKEKIYQTYSSMAKSAGEKGAAFDTKPIVKKLSSAADDLKNNPQVRKYADDLIDDIIELKGQAPEVIEARIADLNRSLSGFYEGRIGQAKAQVDASVARLMREELDRSITEAMGQGYQGLKGKYGALKSIEKEVQHRATVFGRQNKKGLADFTDIFTGAEIISGAGRVAAGDATGIKNIISGLTGMAIKSRIKSINNADNIIKKMFSEVDDIITKETAGPKSQIFSDLKKLEEMKKFDPKNPYNFQPKSKNTPKGTP